MHMYISELHVPICCSLQKPSRAESVESGEKVSEVVMHLRMYSSAWWLLGRFWSELEDELRSYVKHDVVYDL